MPGMVSLRSELLVQTAGLVSCSFGTAIAGGAALCSELGSRYWLTLHLPCFCVRKGFEASASVLHCILSFSAEVAYLDWPWSMYKLVVLDLPGLPLSVLTSEVIELAGWGVVAIGTGRRAILLF